MLSGNNDQRTAGLVRLRVIERQTVDELIGKGDFPLLGVADIAGRNADRAGWQIDQTVIVVIDRLGVEPAPPFLGAVGAVRLSWRYIPLRPCRTERRICPVETGRPAFARIFSARGDRWGAGAFE